MATQTTRDVRGQTSAYGQVDREIEGIRTGSTRHQYLLIIRIERFVDVARDDVCEFAAVHHGTFAGRPNDTTAARVCGTNDKVRLKPLDSRANPAVGVNDPSGFAIVLGLGAYISL